MIAANGPKVTAEDVKEVVRRYAEDNLPGWACAGVSFRLGDVGASITETLVVLPCEPKATPAVSS